MNLNTPIITYNIYYKVPVKAKKMAIKRLDKSRVSKAFDTTAECLEWCIKRNRGVLQHLYVHKKNGMIDYCLSFTKYS